MWGAVFLLAVAGTVIADPSAIFPEDAVRMSGSRIVSGWEAEVGQFPHQVGLRTVTPAGRVFGCGGTVLSPEWALTAAHCTAGGVTIVLRIGATNMTQPALIFETTKYYNYPLYNEAIPSVVQPHDIGLIEFGRSISFNELIQPIRIQASFAKDKNYDGLQAIASGWGATWTQGSSPEVLNWVYLRLISNEECRRAFFWSSIIAPSTICTRGYQISSQSTCQGDSGGPLTIIDEDGGLTQVGVTSFVHGAGCHAGQPAGFIRPGHYHDWFTEVSGINFDWDLDLEEPATSEAPEEPETIATEADVPSAESDDISESNASSESAESSYNSTEVLNWVFLGLISNQECRVTYGDSSIIANSTICTRGWSSPTESTCQGDSGGPLIVNDNDQRATQVGVTSFVSGLGCHAGVPSGFIRPGHYHEWFEEVTGVSFDWEFAETTAEPITDTTTTYVTSSSFDEWTYSSYLEYDVYETDAPEDDAGDASEEFSQSFESFASSESSD